MYTAKTDASPVGVKVQLSEVLPSLQVGPLQSLKL